MKKIITLCIVCLATISTGWAQGVGIGTTNPQEALHIAGNNSTVRLEGLNNINNPKNKGGADLYNVVVDSNGNLTLLDISGEMSSEATVSSPVVLQTMADSGKNSNELYTKTFTLTQRAYVVVTYYISMEFESYDGSAKIVDGRTKIANNYWYLGNGLAPDTSKKYGMTTTVYTNANCDTASGYIYNSRTVTMPLDAGTYSVHLNGEVYGGGMTADAAFRVTFGDYDRLDLSVIYL
ncbi:MAG: hypothetical protein KJO05_07730 [Bacteroidia bacterium]|nr:hypothetical protein [Bacteroidia bacterium]NNF31946.1 hypothetical protein [Flavobacteriaceae bacterium]MBT8275095.1 hypothetical protein [Bacteroidia bacterium]NNJ81239.1 hypothetical protein [Flavobacteriaceae bacterium]NNK52921.1 hypothetical protein [Flavobacteriaceae bacterium]